MAGAAKALRYVTFGLMTTFAVFGSAFVVGETMDDPGGIAGVVLSASWFVPMVALAIWAIRRPDAAGKVLAVAAIAVAAFVVLDELLGIVPRDDVGPVGSIAVFAIAVPLGFLGLRNPGRAGALMVLIGAANLAGVFGKMAGSEDGASAGAGLGGSSGAVAVPLLILGALFVLAAALEPHRDQAAPDREPGRDGTHSTRAGTQV